VNAEGIRVTGRLVPCPECHAVMVLQNGVIQAEITFWTQDGVFDAITAHTPECEYRGKALPQ